MNLEIKRLVVRTVVIITLFAGGLYIFDKWNDIDRIHAEMLDLVESNAHMNGFVAGAIWGTQQSFPIDEYGQTEVEMSVILDVQNVVWNEYKKGN